MKGRGIFITLEGIDGSGKTTQLRQLAGYLRTRGLRVRVTREPGGTPLGEQIRRTLLAPATLRIGALAELALMYAARAEHLDEVVRPALARREVVLSDRFNDASLAYQGYGRGLGVEIVRTLDRIICQRTQPDLTLVLDLHPRRALLRAHSRKKPAKRKLTRFEAEGLKFLDRVRRGYLAIARQNPSRVKVVRAERAAGEVQAGIRRIVETFLERRGKSESRQRRVRGQE